MHLYFTQSKIQRKVQQILEIQIVRNFSGPYSFSPSNIIMLPAWNQNATPSMQHHHAIAACNNNMQGI